MAVLLAQNDSKALVAANMNNDAVNDLLVSFRGGRGGKKSSKKSKSRKSKKKAKKYKKKAKKYKKLSKKYKKGKKYRRRGRYHSGAMHFGTIAAATVLGGLALFI